MSLEKECCKNCEYLLTKGDIHIRRLCTHTGHYITDENCDITRCDSYKCDESKIGRLDLKCADCDEYDCEHSICWHEHTMFNSIIKDKIDKIDNPKDYPDFCPRK